MREGGKRELGEGGKYVLYMQIHIELDLDGIHFFKVGSGLYFFKVGFCFFKAGVVYLILIGDNIGCNKIIIWQDTLVRLISNCIDLKSFMVV